MNTILAEKKNNNFLIITIVFSFLCLVASGFLYYKSLSLNKIYVEKVETLQKQLDELQKSLTVAQKTIEEKDKLVATLTGDLNRSRQELERIKISQTQVSTTAEPKILKDQVLTDKKVEKAMAVIFFDFNSSEVNLNKYEKDLQAVADLIKRKDAALILEGHSDPTGDKNYNVWLSGKRAENVKKIILNMVGGKMPCNIISVGVGSSKQTEKIPNREKRKVIVTAIEDCKEKL